MFFNLPHVELEAPSKLLRVVHTENKMRKIVINIIVFLKKVLHFQSHYEEFTAQRQNYFSK